jgi:hypothetical protein
MRRILPALLSLACLAGCGTSPTNLAQGRDMLTAGAKSRATGVKRALMVGINEYESVNQLSGCVNDIIDTKAQVLAKEGFDPANTVTLLDEQATRANILAALEKLVADTKPGDFLYFHYSGHGAQIPDTNGDEKEDGQDEIICPVNCHFEGDAIVDSIVDDEIQSLFGKLPAGAGLFMVSDSCHSGSIDQGMLRRSRGITLPKGIKNKTPLRADAAGMATFRSRVASAKYTGLTGCQDDQTSADAFINNRWNGALTFCMLEAFKGSNAKTTYAELEKETIKNLKKRGYDQDPNLVGATNIPLFSIAK